MKNKNIKMKTNKMHRKFSIKMVENQVNKISKKSTQTKRMIRRKIKEMIA
jgi:hypothetical protein